LNQAHTQAKWQRRAVLILLLARFLISFEASANTNFVGSASCRECHPTQYALWAESAHAHAERRIDLKGDRIAFEPARSFHHASQTSQALLTNGQCQLVTLGFQSNVAPYKIERVIGYEPLRQFLTASPGSRWQVQELAYDPKAKDWFNVYGDEDRRPGEWGHWTGRGMNWNSRCAYCHNTALRKNYNEASDTYRTTLTEPAVSCEACHGPLAAHNTWRKEHPDPKQVDPTFHSLTRNQTIGVCASCHSRRDQLTEDFNPGDSFYDHFSLEILDEASRWYPDGQIKDEDYEFESFLSSRMHESGVHCRDCHRSDSPKGNTLCMTCHQGNFPGFTNAPVINLAEHSHHKLMDKGGECIGCHMPVTTYMQRHPRHDHGFTVPDPLLTKELGIPNACNRCHPDKSADWSLEYTEKWYGRKMDRPARDRTRSIAAALHGDDSAKPRLLALLAAHRTGEGSMSKAASPYWAAVAANLLYRWAADPEVKTAVLAALKDPNPLVREKAVLALESQATDPQIATTLKHMLADSARCVRVAAAWVLRATADPHSLAARELQHSLDLEADQPRGQFRKAMFLLARNQPDEALVHLQKAVAWDQSSPPLRYQTAMLLDRIGRTSEALETLSSAEKLAPNDPQFPYSRAVILAREGRTEEARVAAKGALRTSRDFKPANELLEKISSPRDL
jgi:Flp pilus assembly protein TadD